MIKVLLTPIVFTLKVIFNKYGEDYRHTYYDDGKWNVNKYKRIGNFYMDWEL